ncbi:MAG TPA: hypothetical protein V6D03_03675, partial [Candidatus Caenarcaniphilales bacterium]
SGTPTRPNLSGDLQVNHLALNQLKFESRLTGRLRYGYQGLGLQVGGMQDQINLALSSSLQPRSFYVRRGQAIALGQTQDNRLLVELQRFPLAALNLSPNPQANLGPVAGLASGNFDVNLQANIWQGNVAISRPQIGSFSADHFEGQLQFARGVATLKSGELKQANSRYLISGTFTPGADPQFTAQVNVDQAAIQDVLLAVKWFNLADVRRGLRPPNYAKAAAVQPVGVGTPQAPLETQLRRLSEIEALLAQQVARRQSTSPLPDFADLKGTFNGRMQVSGSQRTGVALDFDLQGQNFSWGSYAINQMIASGRFQNGVLELRPLRLQTGDSLVAFT